MIRHDEEHHLGNKIYNSQHARAMDGLESYLNSTTKRALLKTGCKTLGKEDLSFTTDKGKKGAQYNRKMSSWLKGRLNERMDYKAKVYRIAVTDVNAAYTSQYCAECGNKLLRREGKHNEKGICPCCKEINANVNAAKNIRSRLHDAEITLYTPYRRVKEILDGRIQKSEEKVS